MRSAAPAHRAPGSKKNETVAKIDVETRNLKLEIPPETAVPRLRCAALGLTILNLFTSQRLHRSHQRSFARRIKAGDDPRKRERADSNRRRNRYQARRIEARRLRQARK